MEEKSVWKSRLDARPSLKGEDACEILVIGGGIAGYLTAYMLAEAGKDVVLIEADRLFSGTTGRTTAKITSNQGDIYLELAERYGEDVAEQYYDAQREGMRGFYKLVNELNIDCDFQETDGYIFATNRSEKLKKTYEVMRSFGANCEFVEDLNGNSGVCAIKEGGQYLFDPLKFLSALPVRFGIYENTRAINVDLQTKTVICGGGEITAEKIVVATHFPIINFYGGYIFKLKQSESYTVAVNKKLCDEMYLDERAEGLSVRPYAGGTLLGIGDHRTGKGERGSISKLCAIAEKYAGENTITNCWGSEDVMTFDGMPMAGRYADGLDDIYVVTGFNKWGMANSMTCAKLICDMICFRENCFEELFSPQRKVVHSSRAFLSNAAINVKEILKGYFNMSFKTVADVPRGSGMIVRYRGKERAVYRDDEGKLHVIGKMCPHMHGELKWNADTKTWDCPCHGSRFDIHGNIVSEPSTKRCKCTGGKKEP